MCGVSCDRHSAGDALHCLHLAARRRQLLFAFRLRLELARLCLYRGRRRGDIRAQRALVLCKVARVDASLRQPAAHFFD
ncbi:hypothetical protein WM31_30855 [Burkholderia ubonensis]|nr:hypothetical protein WM31_30855 [Burkholderia ubonensis]